MYKTDKQKEYEIKRICRWAKKVRSMFKIDTAEAARLSRCSAAQILRWEAGVSSPDLPKYINWVVSYYKMRRSTMPKYVQAYMDSPEVKARIEWYQSEGYELYSTRKAYGMSRAFAALYVGCTESQIARLEQNKYVPGKALQNYRAFLQSTAELYDQIAQSMNAD